MLVGAPNNAAGGKDAGRAYLYSGKDGRMLATWTGERAGDAFGSTVAGYTNGKRPFSSSARRAPDRTRRAASTSTTGSSAKPQFVIESDATGDALGDMFLSVPGDVDGDGVPDVYATDFGNTARGASTGRVYVLSGKTGKTLLTLTGETAGEGFGIGPSAAGDVDGDGHARPDRRRVAVRRRRRVGRPRVPLLGQGRQAAEDLHLPRFRATRSASTRSGMGDIDGDGTIDFLITSAWSGIHGNHSGRVFLISSGVKKNPTGP